MAGHSLWGFEGRGREGWERRTRRREEVQGWKAGKWVKRGERGKERRTVAWVSHGRSITRHSEVKRGGGGWGRKRTKGRGACDKMGDAQWSFFCLCWGSQRFLQSKALETSWRSNSVTLTFINRYPSVKTVIRSHNRPSVMKHTDAGRYAWGWSAEGSHETEIRWLQGGGETVVRCTPRFRCHMLLQRHLNRPHGHQGKKEDDSESPN